MSGKKWWLLLGGAATAVVLWRKLQGVAPPKSPFMAPGRHGTAVVTGASAGIGTAYARQLAALGYDVWLIARRADRLEALAAELRQRYGVNITPYPADLTQLAEVETLAQTLSQINNLELLVNNAGFGTKGHLHETTTESQLDMLHLHVDAPMVLTKAVLPGMIARRYGGIVNVSSIMGLLRAPGNVNYCGSKAYLNAFAEALQMEVAEQGLFVQALCPGYTRTEFHDTAEFTEFNRDSVPASLWMTPEEVVLTSLQALGSGQVVVIPGWRYRWVVKSAQKGFSLRRLRRLGELVSRKF
jgi:uncharacterized protein